ncbi:MAG: PAS domain S-box protein [Bacteroidetes bacterium]|nr:PAS domain S-box protein [Bacteroidota bacterium]
MKYFIKISVILILQSACLYSQKDEGKFERLSEGLSQNSVLCMSQDSRGFMWFGTYDGLNRYDGYKIKIYKSEIGNVYSLSNNAVRYIFEDHSGIIWIGTDGGLNQYDRQTEKFISYKNDPNDPNSLSSNMIQWICEDTSGTLWIATFTGGLNRFDRDKKQFIRYMHDPDDPNSICHNQVACVYIDSKKRLWAATNGGLNQFDYKRNCFIAYKHKPDDPKSLAGNGAYRIFEDRNGAIWIGVMGGGLDRYDEEKNQFIHHRNKLYDPKSLSNDRVRSIYEDRSGSLWIGTDDGLNRYDRERRSFIHYKHNSADPFSISNNAVLCIYEDQSGILWIGSDYGGVNKLDRGKTKFLHYRKKLNDPNSLSSDLVSSICETNENGEKILWIATEGGGLNKFNRRRNTFKHYLANTNNPNSIQDNHLRVIIEDHSGLLWIGTNTGLYEFDRKREKFICYKADPNDPNSLSNEVVFSICEDRQGSLWLGTYGGGLNLFDRASKRFIHYRNNPKDSNSLSDDFIWSICEDKDGALWIGTANGGLNRFDREKNQFKCYKNDPGIPNSLSSNKVLCLHVDKSGVLWAGTTDGLNKFDRSLKAFTHYREEHGLLSNTIQSILEDDHENLWLGTQKGLSKFTPGTISIRNFTVSSGIQGNEFSVNGGFKSQSGELYIGGINGFNVFFPDSIKTNPYIPPVVITDFQVFNKSVHAGKELNGHMILNKSITETKELELSYKENVFLFEFASLHFASPYNNQYAYMMEGFDSDWNYTDADRRIATYTNLESREYFFRVKGTNSDGLWNDEGTSIRITISPPFWQTLWFKLVLAAILAGCVFWIYKWREMIEKQRKLEEISRNEKKYRSIFENSLAGIVKFSLETWEVLDSNKAVKQIFGCASEQELSSCFSSLPPQNIQDIQKLLLSGDLIQEYEIRTTRLDGKELWILFSAKMIGEEHLAHGVIVDITERKVSQDKITEQAMLLDKAQDAIMVTDYEGRITFWNNGAELIYGWNRGQAVGKYIRDIFFDTAHAKEYDLAMEDLLQFGEWNGEQHHLNKAGNELLIQGRWKQVESLLTKKKVILIVNSDITEKKRQELKLQRAQKMESIALLTGGIAHDLQNVLAPVAISVNLLREKLTDPPSMKVLNAVEESARSGLDLIKNIITYGHGIPGERVKVDLLDLIESILKIVKQSLPETISIEKQTASKDHTVLGDVNQLKQVFLNIIVNARDAMPKGGQITIGIDKVTIDENSLDQCPEAQAGKYHLIKICDTGTGIPEDRIERIFEPFFTTKSSGNGTGLGLSIAMGIVKSHSGFITVHSVIDKGTEFKIYLSALNS